MIRSHDFFNIECNIVCERISASIMCKGPAGTILVFDDDLWAIYQLEYLHGAFYFIDQWPVGPEGIVRMCYSDKCQILVVLHVDKFSLTGIHLPTGQVAWRQNDLETPSSTSGEIGPLPDGTFCLLNGTEIIVLDSLSGSIMYALVDLGDLEGPIWTMATTSDDKQHKFAIQHGTVDEIQITVYSAPYFQYRVNQYLPLRVFNSNDY